MLLLSKSCVLWTAGAVCSICGSGGGVVVCGLECRPSPHVYSHRCCAFASVTAYAIWLFKQSCDELYGVVV